MKCAIKEVDIFSAVQQPLQQKVLPWRKQVPDVVVYYSTEGTEEESGVPLAIIAFKMWESQTQENLGNSNKEKGKYLHSSS